MNIIKFKNKNNVSLQTNKKTEYTGYNLFY
jgi:hypothetical protein